MVFDFHLILVRVKRFLFFHLFLYFLHSLWFRSLLFLNWKEFCEKAGLLLLFSFLCKHTRLLYLHSWLFDRHHLSFLRFLYFIGYSFFHSHVFTVKFLLFCCILSFLEIIVHVLSPCIIILAWLSYLSSWIQCCSVGSNSLVDHIDISPFLHFFAFSCG